MSTLATLQQRVAEAIRLRDDELVELIDETTTVDRQTRLGVYQEAYVLRLDEALRSNYPKLHRLLGDEAMLALTQAYQATTPSRRPSIRWFGDTLPTFLTREAPYAAQPIFAELARFEWALGSVFDATDAPALAVEMLGQLNDEDWPQLRVAFHPAFSLLTFGWNAVAVWRALNDETAPPTALADQQHWAVWRHDLQPRYRSVPADEAALIAALQAQQPFAEACEALLAWHTEDDAPSRAAGLLGQWLGEGWVTQLHR